MRWKAERAAPSRDLCISSSILYLASRQEDLSGSTCVPGDSFRLQFSGERNTIGGREGGGVAIDFADVCDVTCLVCLILFFIFCDK